MEQKIKSFSKELNRLELKSLLIRRRDEQYKKLAVLKCNWGSEQKTYEDKFFKKIGIHSMQAEQPLQGMELQQKKHKKNKAYKKSL